MGAYDKFLLADFGFYAALVLLKVLLMAPLTAYFRITRKAFANTEDAATHPQGRVDFHNEDVERVRRAHLNDLENVVPFVLIGLVYVLTANPAYSWALLHFRVFVAARYLHTLFYIAKVPQPARGLSFFVGMLVCLSMIFQILF